MLNKDLSTAGKDPALVTMFCNSWSLRNRMNRLNLGVESCNSSAHFKIYNDSKGFSLYSVVTLNSSPSAGSLKWNF